MFRRLTFDKLGNGLREGLDTAGQVPGVLLDMLPQPLGAVHPGLHFLVELWPTPRRKREGEREREREREIVRERKRERENINRSQATATRAAVTQEQS